MAPRIVILADDLSGAADCAMACHRAGMTAQVRLDPFAPGASTEALALDLDSRALPVEEALALTMGVMDQVREGALYRKIDSTLRGHVALEIAATLQIAGPEAFALICPAYPATGRTMRGGAIFVRGQPLAETEIWRLGGEGSTDLKTLLAQVGLAPAVLGLDAVRGPDLAGRIAAAREDGAGAIVCDAETESDMRALIAAALPMPGVVWVGSGGLTIPLAEALSPGPASDSGTMTRGLGPTLVVVGSASSVSREQLAVLSQDSRVLTLTVQPDVLLDGPEGPGWRPASRALVAAVGKAGKDTVAIAIDPASPFDPGVSAVLSAALGMMAGRQLGRFGALVATGGETARVLLGVGGIRCLDIRRELEPGIVLSQAGRLPVVTKAGAFGDAGSLVRAVDALRRLPPCLTGRSGASVPTMHAERNDRPAIAITMGDAAGVGPEIIVKALAHTDLYGRCRPLVVGDARRLERAVKLCGLSLGVRRVQGAADADFEAGIVDCLDLGLIPDDLPFGQLSAVAGDAAYQYVKRAVDLARAGEVAAICTAPLNKEALHAGGHIYPGHTELLADLCGVPEVSMMLTAPGLRVIHVTVHIGLLDAIAKIEPRLVERTIARGRETLEKAGIADPRIGVCGINPHAGENGLFGHGEEESKIIPAVQRCQARGWRVDGPLPADTLFYRAARGDFDLVVAMYHDQGHGPVKVLGIEAGVNITVGLPVVRTSVDHGTAFDIAGTGRADERSLLEALQQAMDLAPAPQFAA